MHRFFLEPEYIKNNEILFPEETSRQMARVLRLSPGKHVSVLDDSGKAFLTELLTVSEKACTGRIIEQSIVSAEPKLRLTMMLGLTQREKFEWMLQKCTEVGAAAFLPVITSRSLIQQPHEVHSKYPRWEKILREAAEQSGRGKIPELLPPLPFEEAIAYGKSSNEICLVAWEAEQHLSLKNVIAQDVQRAAMLIGPEGGFSQEEITLAAAQGYLPVSLGSLTLRMETAAIVAAALVLHQLGGN